MLESTREILLDFFEVLEFAREILLDVFEVLEFERENVHDALSFDSTCCISSFFEYDMNESVGEVRQHCEK